MGDDMCRTVTTHMISPPRLAEKSGSTRNITEAGRRRYLVAAAGNGK